MAGDAPAITMAHHGQNSARTSFFILMILALTLPSYLIS
jgi:hypothetical protein